VQPALHKQTHAPAPDEITHTLYRAYTRAVHDVEYDVPIQFEEKEEEQWELNTFATCECLAWRGVWNAEERRRRQNVDVGQTIYLGLPYYGRWLMTAALILVDKQYVTLAELTDRIAEVKKRYEQARLR
jgi:hypothetical protein